MLLFAFWKQTLHFAYSVKIELGHVEAVRAELSSMWVKGNVKLQGSRIDSAFNR